MTGDGPIDLKHELSELTAGKLQLCGDVREANWHCWEKRSLNLHRVVALCTYAPAAARDLETQVRETLGGHFRCAWWRGLGFGVVIEIRDVVGFPEEYRPLVDGRANPKGTWQWVILVSRARRRAWGLHTWLEGYLSPIYRGLLGRLEEQGFEIASVRKEKDGLMRLLTAMKPEHFPDFENDVGESRRPLTRQ
jgi:hypothetical protein